MSLGSIIGGIAGGVIGFFAYGPVGAYYGAVIGFGIGMAVDPITPDIPTAGIPDPQQQVMNAEIGGPIPDLCGTAKPTGKLLFFGKERNEKAYSEAVSGGGKGGSPEPEPQVSGYKYFQSWGVGIVQCPDNPVDVLYAIYKNDDVDPVWPSADVDDESWTGLSLPVSGGQETIILDGIGSLVFSFGTDDQMPIAAVGEIITDSTLNTPYRYLCWAFFDDCYIGEYNRTPTYKFVLKKIPQIAAMPDNAQIYTYDCNPAHAMYYILNTLSGLPVSWLNADDFNAIAETLFDEERGICLLLDNQQSALNYIENINGHIDNILRYGSDGQFHPKLIRNDYVVGDLPLIDKDVMLDNPSFNRGSWIDTVNELKVQYSEIINGNRMPEPTDLPEGELVAALEQRGTDYIYVYDITNYAVVKIDTSDTNPVVVDWLEINDADYDLDYSMGPANSQRGSYCISKDYNKIWYLFRNSSNGNLRLVEVDITQYPMTITKTSLHSAIMPGEEFNDACGDDNYAFFCTDKISGRILKFDSDHTLTDKNFNYSATGAQDAGIATMCLNPDINEIAWVYTRAVPFLTAHYPYSDYSFNIRITRSRTEGGIDASQWQNFLRHDELYNHIFYQRSYHPTNGVAYYYDGWEIYGSPGGNWLQGLQYMQQYLGGNSPYFYVLSMNNENNVWLLNRITNVTSDPGQALPLTSTVVTSYVNRFSTLSKAAIYNENNNKSFIITFNSSNGLNYFASFNSSLSLISDFAPDTIYWGQ